jgi:magnesium transporter
VVVKVFQQLWWFGAQQVSAILKCMIHRYTHDSLTWIDLESPAQEEVRGLMEEFDIDPLIAEELINPTLRSRIDMRDTYFYLVLHFPALRHSHSIEQIDQEVDFIVGKNWIITTRYDSIDPFHTFSKIFEVNSILDKTTGWQHAGHIFFHMTSTLYTSLVHELEHIEDRLEVAEASIFDGMEKEMVMELSRIGRDLLDLHQILGPHKTMLDSLFNATEPLFGIEFGREVRMLIGEYYRTWNIVDAHGASLRELRETNNSLLTTKQNEITKLFTILAFVTFPLSLFASIFGMNTAYTPILGGPYDFWVIVGIMTLCAVCFFAYFKHKHWI